MKCRAKNKKRKEHDETKTDCRRSAWPGPVRKPHDRVAHRFRGSGIGEPVLVDFGPFDGSESARQVQHRREGVPQQSQGQDRIRPGHRRVRPIHHRLLRRQGIGTRHGRRQDPHLEHGTAEADGRAARDRHERHRLARRRKDREGQAVLRRHGIPGHDQGQERRHRRIHAAHRLTGCEQQSRSGRAEGRDRHRQWHRRHGLQSGEGRHMDRSRRRGGETLRPARRLGEL